MGRRRFFAGSINMLAAWLGAGTAVACPFCGTVGRSLAERRDAAEVAAVGEAAGAAARDDAGLLAQPFELRQPIRGAIAGLERVTARVEGPVEGTAILFGGGRDAADRWEAVAADEPLLAHVAAAPATNVPAANRLPWFAARLEHPDRRIAEDAFAEFGLASFEAVREAAGAFDAEKLRAWLAEPAIDQRRRGFYGLALGVVAAAARDTAERERCLAALRIAVDAPGSDLRAGFDGLLAGLLVAEGPGGLDAIVGRGLLAADTRAGDARHALAALRFAWESLADTLPRDRVAAATGRLLANPAVAADAVVDLARYRRWDDAPRVAAVWDAFGRDDPVVRRAVAGYLTACPAGTAGPHIDRIRAAEPNRWQEAVAAAGPR